MLNNKLTITISFALFFALATVAFFLGLGPLSTVQDQAWIPGFFSLVFVMLSFYYIAEIEQRKNILLMLVALVICVVLPLAAGLLMMTNAI